MGNFTDQRKAAFLQDAGRCLVFRQSVRLNGANFSARKCMPDECACRLASEVLIPITGRDSVRDLYGSFSRRGSDETAQTNNDVVDDVDDGEAILPGIGRSRIIQSRQKFRGDFWASEEIPDAVRDFDAEAAFENVSSFEKSSDSLRCLRHEVDVARLHDGAHAFAQPC